MEWTPLTVDQYEIVTTVRPVACRALRAVVRRQSRHVAHNITSQQRVQRIFDTLLRNKRSKPTV